MRISSRISSGERRGVAIPKAEAVKSKKAAHPGPLSLPWGGHRRWIRRWDTGATIRWGQNPGL